MIIPQQPDGTKHHNASKQKPRVFLKLSGVINNVVKLDTNLN